MFLAMWDRDLPCAYLQPVCLTVAGRGLRSVSLRDATHEMNLTKFLISMPRVCVPHLLLIFSSAT